MDIAKIRLSRDKQTVIFITEEGEKIETGYGSENYKKYISSHNLSRKAEKGLRGVHKKLFGISEEEVVDVYLTGEEGSLGEMAAVHFTTNFGRKAELAVRVSGGVLI